MSSIAGSLFTDIVIIFLAAFLGGLLARSLRLPVLLGYLAVGMVIGPHVLGVVGEVDTVRVLAEFGVILLLFSVGIEISFRDLRNHGKVVVLGGIGQIAGTAVVAYFIGIALGWHSEQAAVFGLVVSLSSTMVVLKTLTDLGQLRSVHGQVLTGNLLVQDLAFVPMMAILPALGGEAGGFLADFALGIAKAAVVLGLMALLGGKAIPWLLSHVAHLGSREVFILTVVAIIFTIAAITESVGLSAALGAFVAGLLLNQSDFGHRALSEVVPLRHVFSALFFVSLGMLTEPAFLAENWRVVLVTIGVAVLVKFALTASLTRAFGYLPHTALLTGLGIGQVGEFSFILAGSAVTLGIVGDDFLSLIVVSAVVTMAMTPWVMNGGERAINGLSQRVSLLRPYRLGNKKSEERQPSLEGHVVVCGFGHIGSLVAQALSEHAVNFIVIDLDPQMVVQCRGQGHPAIHGESGSEAVLEAAGVKFARLMVISTADPISAWVTAQQALHLNPDLDIVARVHSREEGERLQRLGVREVVWPEMEAGLGMVRHSLQRYRTASEAEGALPAEGLSEDGKIIHNGS